MKPTNKTSTTRLAAAKSTPVTAAKPLKKPDDDKPVKCPAAPPVPLHAPEATAGVTHDAIATRAYFIYGREGRPQGRELQHWLEAEAQLTRRYN